MPRPQVPPIDAAWLVAGVLVCTLATPLRANGAVIFVDLGTAAPPGTLGSYSMTTFPDLGGEGLSVSSVLSPLGGAVLLSPALIQRDASLDAPWTGWGHSYGGDVFVDLLTPLTVTLTLPSMTGAFYFYAAGGQPGSRTITVVDQDGNSYSGVAKINLDGAYGFGFYGTGATTLSAIVISTRDNSQELAVGEFGIAGSDNPPAVVPEPMSVLLLGSGLGGLAFGRRRRRPTA